MDGRRRRSLRLPGYDYTDPGAYFVTICTHLRIPLFGGVEGGKVVRSPAGRIAASCWMAIPHEFEGVDLDAWMLMPNHLHGILWIDDSRGEASQSPTPDNDGPPSRDASPLRLTRPRGTVPGSLGAIVQNFKSVSARRINIARGTPGATVWQRNYHERVVRDERALDTIREYIVGNPAGWDDDPERPKAKC